MYKVALTFFLGFFIFSAFAQVPAHRTCASHELHQHHIKQNKAVSDDAFENWLQQRIAAKNKAISLQKTTAPIYTIPVVVHVLHKGEAVGTGSNISLSQVQSQIRILNEDFRRQSGTNGFNTHPNGADCEIEFCLAQIDPNGCPTDGVVRVQGSQTSWEAIVEDVAIKSESFWDPEKYMNIWVCDLNGNTLGYAQFPEASGLPGMPTSSQNAETDGVVIDYEYFGDEGTATAPFDLGRTTTHEVGHWLGLRHSWGDGGCGVDDFCSDTPGADQDYYSAVGVCDNPGNQCGQGTRMIENYMDYSDDGCMNIFTTCQKTRMRTVLENSPRRMELLTSNVCSASPSLVADNAAINNVSVQQPGTCDDSLEAPEVTLYNLGSNNLTSVDIVYNYDGGADSVINWTGNLAGGACNTFDVITLNKFPSTPGQHQLHIHLENTNGNTDGDQSNDTSNTTVEILAASHLPYFEGFEGADDLPLGWKINNPDVSYTWQKTTAVRNTFFNEAYYINFYDYSSYPEEDELISTPANLDTLSSAWLTFKVASASYTGASDGLDVYISNDCEATWSLIYSKSGLDLATVGNQSNPWSPTSQNDWRFEAINISSYVGDTNVTVKFVGINDFGNNLYLDNIIINETGVNALSTASLPNISVDLFPNPTNGEVTFNVIAPEATDYHIAIVNTLGEEVYRSSTLSSQSTAPVVDLSGLQSGLYIANIYFDDYVVNKKVVLEK